MLHSETVAVGMWRLCVCFLFFSTVSAVHPHSGHVFYYTKQMSIFRRNSEEECRVCFGHDCVPLTEYKCQYYMATSELLQTIPDDDEEVAPNNELQSKIDKMLYEFIDNTQQYKTMTCIPMLSKYTDCQKENQCTGCTTCMCDEGRWVCEVQECHTERLDFSRQLTVALASLRSEVTETATESQNRRKRSTNKTSENDFETKITFEELAQWMNDTKNMGLEEEVKHITPTTVTYPTKKTTPPPDELAFEEVLSNIALDNNKIRRKNPKSEPIDGDYVSFVDIVSANTNFTDIHTNRYANKAVIETKRLINDNSFTVDLLENLKDKFEREFKIHNNTGRYRLKQNSFEINNYLDDNSFGIVKRDVSTMNDSNVLPNEEIGNNTDTVRDFKNNVFYPLMNIVNDKENELNQLLAIKNSLIELIKGMDKNFSLDLAMINSTARNKTLFSIYKLEIVPEASAMSDLETRRFGGKFKERYSMKVGEKSEELNSLDMYLQKLRLDVFEIIKDLKAIKQSLNSKKLPKDLSLLLRGLNHYVRSQGKSFMKSYDYLNKLRRFLPDENKTKRMALEILELYDKEVGVRGSINQLSDTTKGILQRIVKHNQIDDFVTYGVRISDPEDALTKDLKSIGSKWPEISENFLNHSPSDKLYNLKLLHLMLTVDIDKMTNVMKLLNFAQNRRVDLDTTLSNQEITRVQNDISDLNDKVQNYIRSESGQSDITKERNDTENLEPEKRRSFLKQIKNLFKTSRNDVRSLLHKKVSKSEIVKELAKNKLGELAKKKIAQYEDTLKKWQTKFSVRSKRSTYDFRKLNVQIKNILPLYLRGKVNPAIDKSKKERQTRKYIKYGTDFKDRIDKGHNNSKTTVKHKATTPKGNIGKGKEKVPRKNKDHSTSTTRLQSKVTTPYAEIAKLKQVVPKNTRKV